MRILVVNAVIPFPPIGGGKLRAYHLFCMLAASHAVTLIGSNAREILRNGRCLIANSWGKVYRFA